MRLTRAEHPFPMPPFMAEPEGYNDVHMEGVAYRWEHPLEPAFSVGALRRQCPGRLPNCPFHHVSQEVDNWRI